MSERWVLPSGASFQLGAGELERVRGLFGAELSGLEGSVESAQAEPLSLLDLSLEDFHTLRGLLRRTGRIVEPEIELHCDNCRAPFRIHPCSTLELGPYRDGELDDPELDEPFDFARCLELPELGPVRLVPRRVREAEPAHLALADPQAMAWSSDLVAGLGIAELNGETDPTKIAEALDAANSDALDALASAFELAHYPPRLCAAHTCPECGARATVPVPRERELGILQAPAPPDDEDFMSLDAFEHLVREEAERAYRDLGVREVALEVVDGPAAVDEGGVALLGSYQPPDPHGLLPDSARIQLFFRSFVNEHAVAAYDVRAEVAETLRHELEHHLAFLAGHDEVDDAERDAIADELSRRVGKSEVQRRAAREIRGELSAFFARTWFVWVIAAVASLMTLMAAQR